MDLEFEDFWQAVLHTLYTLHTYSPLFIVYKRTLHTLQTYYIQHTLHTILRYTHTVHKYIHYILTLLKYIQTTGTQKKGERQYWRAKRAEIFFCPTTHLRIE